MLALVGIWLFEIGVDGSCAGNFCSNLLIMNLKNLCYEDLSKVKELATSGDILCFNVS